MSDFNLKGETMSKALETVSQPTEIDADDGFAAARWEELCRQDCPFAKEGKPWAPVKIGNDELGMTGRAVGTFYAAWFINHLKQHAAIDIADLLPQTVAAMFGRKLDPMEHAFFYGLSDFIKNGDLWIDGGFTAKFAGAA